MQQWIASFMRDTENGWLKPAFNRVNQCTVKPKLPHDNEKKNTYITRSYAIHGEQVVAVSKLKPNHFQRSLERNRLKFRSVWYKHRVSIRRRHEFVSKGHRFRHKGLLRYESRVSGYGLMQKYWPNCALQSSARVSHVCLRISPRDGTRTLQILR